VHTVPLAATGDGDFMLRPAGHADTYDVTLFGRGDGDLFTHFDGPRLAIARSPNPERGSPCSPTMTGAVDSYGAEPERGTSHARHDMRLR
jgi:hypothetical protein